jgi:hypothetical protein
LPPHREFLRNALDFLRELTPGIAETGQKGEKSLLFSL